MNRRLTRVLTGLALAMCGAWGPAARAGDVPEYRLKAAFVFNFMRFTQWPETTGKTLTLCVYGKDPFGAEIDGLRGKTIGARTIDVRRVPVGQSLAACQAAFVSADAVASWQQMAQTLRGQPLLSLADTPGALGQGVVINMGLADRKVTFEASQRAARGAGLGLSSKLLSLATTVQQ